MNEVFIMELIDKLEVAPHGERGAMIKTAAEFLGKSEMTIYRWLDKKGFKTGRKTRVDAGDSEITNDELKAIAGVMRSTDRANKKKLASVEVAIEIAHANKLIKRVYHPATVSRLMRERGLSAKQLRRATPHVTLATKHPNQMWQIDPSYCVLYYLKDGKMRVMDEAKFYKNKPQNFAKIAKNRVLRYVAVDHCSGAFFCYYYNVSGENAETMFDFLMRAFGTKDKQHNPFEGIPKILYWDKGSANQSAVIKNLLDGLGIEHHAHVKGNSRAKGSVEKHNDIIETNFESRLAFEKISSIEQLNAMCETWQRHFQSHRVHSRHGKTRFAAWRMIRAEQLVTRPPVELCRVLLTSKPATRVVSGNYQISYAIDGYGSNCYRVDMVDNVRIGESVKVQVNPYAAPAIWVSHKDQFGEMKRYEIAPLSKDQWGFTEDAVPVDGYFKQAKLTGVDRNRLDLDEMAWGTRDAQKIDKLRTSKSVPAFAGKMNAVSHLEQKLGKTLHIPKKGIALDVEEVAPPVVDINPAFVPAAQARDEVMMSTIDFIRYCGKSIELTPEVNKQIRELYPQGLPESEAEAALKQISVLAENPHLKLVKENVA